MAVTAAAVVLSACSVNVSGSATPQEDLTALALPADDFPYGPAQQIGPDQLPLVLADISGHPLHGRITPADCEPAELPATGAVVLVGPGAVSAATLTEAIVRPGQSLADLTEQVTDCEQFTSGTGPATSEVTRRIETAPDGPAGTETAEVVITSTTGGAGAELTTTITSLIAQSGAIRLYVIDRRLADEGPTGEQREALDDLFDAAVARAFG